MPVEKKTSARIIQALEDGTLNIEVVPHYLDTDVAEGEPPRVSPVAVYGLGVPAGQSFADALVAINDTLVVAGFPEVMVEDVMRLEMHRELHTTPGATIKQLANAAGLRAVKDADRLTRDLKKATDEAVTLKAERAAAKEEARIAKEDARLAREAAAAPAGKAK